MSSTGRSQKRNEHDFYPTPKWCIDRFLEKMPWKDQKGLVFLEPAAGDGAIIRAVNAYCGIDNLSWVTCEIQLSLGQRLVGPSNIEHMEFGDFLEMTDIKHPNVIITNPPFSHAFAFIKKSLELEPEYVCMLLRLNFLGSKERSDFMRTHTPDIYVLPNRPSFTGKGTDSIEYAWFVWSKENSYGHASSRIRDAKLVMLDETPIEERCQ